MKVWLRHSNTSVQARTTVFCLCVAHIHAEAVGPEGSESQSCVLQTASLIPWDILIPATYADMPRLPRAGIRDMGPQRTGPYHHLN